MFVIVVQYLITLCIHVYIKVTLRIAELKGVGPSFHIWKLKAHMCAKCLED